MTSEVIDIGRIEIATSIYPQGYRLIDIDEFPRIQITDLYGILSLTLNFDLEGDL